VRYSSSQFRTQQSAVGGFVGEPSHGGKSLVDAGGRKPAGFQVGPIPGHHNPVEREAGFGTVPSDELFDGKLLCPARSRRTEAAEDDGFRVIEVTEPEHGSAWF